MVQSTMKHEMSSDGGYCETVMEGLSVMCGKGDRLLEMKDRNNTCA